MPRIHAAGLVIGAAHGVGAGAVPGVVIQIHSLSNIPDMDPRKGIDDVSDLYLTFQIVTGGGDPCGSPQRTVIFDDVRDAVYGESCYHTFRTPEDLDDAVLRVKAYDKNGLSRDDKIAHLDINLADLQKAHAGDDGRSTMQFTNPLLSKDGVFQTRRMEMDTKRRGATANEPVSISFRLVPDEELARCSLTKRFFLIRHGESLWNEAQDENNVKGLLKFDHALNRIGINQCKALNTAWRNADVNTLTSLEKEFIHCPVIMCSPLTRCVQTALLSLHSHETLQKNGMTLQRNLREVKSTLGSLDTLGVEIGAENIKNRARNCLLKVCRKTDKEAKKRGSCEKDNGASPLTGAEISARVDQVKVHDNDVVSKWWTPKNTYDNEKSLRVRMDALMGTLRYLPSDAAILVGHSLLFRAIMKSFLSDNYRAEELTREELSSRKIGNAAVVALDVTFPEFPEESNSFEISRVTFLFGSGLAENDK